MRYEFDANLCVINIFIEVENVYFNGFVMAAHRRPAPDVEHAVQLFVLMADPYRIDAIGRYELVSFFDVYIGCGVAQSATQLPAFDDYAGYAVFPAQVLVGKAYVTRFQCLANPGRAYAIFINVLFGYFFYFILVLVCMFSEVFQPAFAVFPKAMVIANDEEAGVEPFVQNHPDVFLGRHLGKCFGKRNFDEVVYAMLFQQIGLFRKGGKEFWSIIPGFEYHAGVGPIGEHDGLTVEFIGCLAKPRQYLLMAEMNTIKSTRGDNGFFNLSDGFRTGVDFHPL